MLQSIGEPYFLDGRELLVSGSIGVSVYPEHGADAETLIKNADTAMYQVKQAGRQSYGFFDITFVSIPVPARSSRRV
jgi:diguanylate cyclase (GGDEF)-like protein